jgi:hypothetical protein
MRFGPEDRGHARADAGTDHGPKGADPNIEKIRGWYIPRRVEDGINENIRRFG